MLDILFIFLFGIVFGSFANVLIYRVPLGKNIAFPPSTTPCCGKQIKWYHNIPLVSYLFLRGKCADCGSKISFVYFATEMLSGLLFVVIFTKEGMGLGFWIASFVFLLLLSLSIIDIRYKAVPDSLNLGALTLAMFYCLHLQSIQSALIMAGAMSFLRFYVSYLNKKESLGEGDIIVAGTMGAILGVKLALFTVFIASLLALPVSLYFKNRSFEFPFIPFLALGSFIAYLFDEPLLEFIQRVYGI